MLKLANELPYDIFEKRFGGEGEVKSTRLLEVDIISITAKQKLTTSFPAKACSTTTANKNRSNPET